MSATVFADVPTTAMSRRQPCPVCKGRGYLTIETHEDVTLCGDRYPITYQVVGYKAVDCWRCGGTRRVRTDDRYVHATRPETGGTKMIYPCGVSSDCPITFALRVAAHQSWTYLDDVEQMMDARDAYTEELTRAYGCKRNGICPMLSQAGRGVLDVANGDASVAREEDEPEERRAGSVDWH